MMVNFLISVSKSFLFRFSSLVLSSYSNMHRICDRVKNQHQYHSILNSYLPWTLHFEKLKLRTWILHQLFSCYPISSIGYSIWIPVYNWIMWKNFHYSWQSNLVTTRIPTTNPILGSMKHNHHSADEVAK